METKNLTHNLFEVAGMLIDRRDLDRQITVVSELMDHHPEVTDELEGLHNLLCEIKDLGEEVWPYSK